MEEDAIAVHGGDSNLYRYVSADRRGLFVAEGGTLRDA
jgi:hypothetical protein